MANKLDSFQSTTGSNPAFSSSPSLSASSSSTSSSSSNTNSNSNTPPNKNEEMNTFDRFDTSSDSDKLNRDKIKINVLHESNNQLSSPSINTTANKRSNSISNGNGNNILKGHTRKHSSVSRRSSVLYVHHNHQSSISSSNNNNNNNYCDSENLNTSFSSTNSNLNDNLFNSPNISIATTPSRKGTNVLNIKTNFEDNSIPNNNSSIPNSAVNPLTLSPSTKTPLVLNSNSPAKFFNRNSTKLIDDELDNYHTNNINNNKDTNQSSHGHSNSFTHSQSHSRNFSRSSVSSTPLSPSLSASTNYLDKNINQHPRTRQFSNNNPNPLNNNINDPADSFQSVIDFYSLNSPKNFWNSVYLKLFGNSQNNDTNNDPNNNSNKSFISKLKETFPNFWVTIFSIISWYIFSLSISLYNKWMFGPHLNFQFPIIITSVHQLILFTLSITCLIIWPKFRLNYDYYNTIDYNEFKNDDDDDANDDSVTQDDDDDYDDEDSNHPRRNENIETQQPEYVKMSYLLSPKEYMTKILPCSLASAGDIGLGNTSFRFITLSLYTMIKTSSLVFVLLWGVLFKLERMTLRILTIVIIMTFGVMMMVVGQHDGNDNNHSKDTDNIAQGKLVDDNNGKIEGHTGGVGEIGNHMDNNGGVSDDSAQTDTYPVENSNNNVGYGEIIEDEDEDNDFYSDELNGNDVNDNGEPIETKIFKLSLKFFRRSTEAKSISGNSNNKVTKNLILLGSMLVLASACMSGLRWALTQIMLKKNKKTKNPILTILYISPGMCLTLIIFGSFIEGFRNFFRSPIWTEKGIILTITLIIIPGLLAFFMTLSEFILLSNASLLTLSIAGIFKELLTIFMGWLVFGDKLSFINIIGLTITLGDIIWYNFYRFEQQKEINDAKTAVANASLSSSAGNASETVNKNDDTYDVQYELNDTEDNYNSNYNYNYNYDKEIGSVNMDMTNTSGNTSTNNNNTTTASANTANANLTNTGNNGNDSSTGDVGISVRNDVDDSIVESIELNHLNVGKSRGASSSSYIIDSESKAK
ncbi:unnamed protein product [[Candida] boidinii]|nr:unnamed protein product [[Candida] boidinii]